MFYFIQQTWPTLLKPISCSKKEITLHLLYATTLNNYVNQSYVKDTCYHIEIVTDEYFKYFSFMMNVGIRYGSTIILRLFYKTEIMEVQMISYALHV